MSCTSRLLWATLPFVFVMPGVTPALAQSDLQMTSLTPLRIPGCGGLLCAPETFARVLRSRLAR